LPIFSVFDDHHGSNSQDNCSDLLFNLYDTRFYLGLKGAKNTIKGSSYDERKTGRRKLISSESGIK